MKVEKKVVVSTTVLRLDESEWLLLLSEAAVLVSNYRCLVSDYPVGFEEDVKVWESKRKFWQGILDVPF